MIICTGNSREAPSLPCRTFSPDSYGLYNFSSSLPINPGNTIITKYLVNFIESKCSHSLSVHCNKIWEIFQIKLRPNKSDQEPWKPSSISREHYSQQITWWISKYCVVASLICTASNSEKLLSTKLCAGILNQYFT